MSAHVLYVVPTFNRAHDLPRTLGAIAAQDWPDASQTILVIDNSSTDDTPAVLAELARSLPCRLEHLRKAPEGPTVARNIGLRRGGDGYVALVDSDVELEPGWTASCVAAMEADPAIAQVGGRLVFGHDPTMLNAYGGEMGFLGLGWDHGEGEPTERFTEPRDVLWMNSSAILLRPGPAVAVGGFDEKFFYAYEEPDLGFRLALAGWRSRVVPDAVARHHVALRVVASHPDFVFHSCKNRVRMGLKIWGLPRLLAFVLLNLGYSLADAAINPPRRDRLRALWWNIANLGDTLRHRRAAQALRCVPDRTIAAFLQDRWFPAERLRGLRRRAVAGAVAGTGADDRAAAKRVG